VRKRGGEEVLKLLLLLERRKGEKGTRGAFFQSCFVELKGAG